MAQLPLNLAGFKLTFDEEFNARSISQNGVGTTWSDVRSGWRFDAASDIGLGRSSFVDAASGYDPFQVAGGALTITAVPDRTAYGHPGSWESGLITTEGDFSQTYGYFEIRADFSNQPGAWDAFWLLPVRASANPNQLPGWQELDVVEHYGVWDQGAYSTIHTTDLLNGVAWQTNRQVYTDLPTPSGYHTYGMNWQQDTISYYIDGLLVGAQPTPSDMHGPMYLVANLATQGATDNNNADAAGVPISSKIDYIRAYSNAPTAVAVNQDAVSAPDSGDPGLHGAIAANSAAQAAPADTLKVHISGDSWSGVPLFSLTVDSKLLGVFSVSALHGRGQTQDVTVSGNFGAGAHQVEIGFLNDAHGSFAYDPDAHSLVNDRNLYVSGLALNGVEYGTSAVVSNTAAVGFEWVDPRAAVLATNGTVLFATPAAPAGSVQTPPPALPQPPTPAPPIAATDKLIIHVSGDSWNGAPELSVAVDGKPVGVTSSVTALHGKGQSQDISITGAFGVGPHSVAISFLNDGNSNFVYDAATHSFLNDRNLYVSGISLSGVEYGRSSVVSNSAAVGYDWVDPAVAVMAANGTVVFGTAAAAGDPLPTNSATQTPVALAPTVPLTPTGQSSDKITIHVSGDSWNGSPQFSISVDGKPVGGVFSVTALHAKGESQDISVTGDFGQGPHQLSVIYLNDANSNFSYDASTHSFVNDRNLYLSGVAYNGKEYGTSAVISNTAAVGYEWVDPHAAVMAANGTEVWLFA